MLTQSVTAPGDTNLSDATVVGGMSVTAVFDVTSVIVSELARFVCVLFIILCLCSRVFCACEVTT